MTFPAMPMLMTPPLDGNYDPGGFAALLAVFLGLAVLFLAPLYILNAVGLYSIASRRRIRNPWLAWVPLGDAWILGRISDQYQDLVLQKQKKRAVSLLALRIVVCIVYILTMVLFFTGLVSLAADATEYQFFSAVMPSILLMPVGIAVSIASTVFTYLAKYDLFRSCDPKNGVLYLIGSLVVKFVIPALEILQPIFVLLCSKKDDGMPRARQEMNVGPSGHEE